MVDTDYQRMWREHPQGTLYPQDLPLPWQTVPHQFSFVGTVSSTFKVTVNGGLAVSALATDGTGGAAFQLVLPVGPAKIEVVNVNTGYAEGRFSVTVLPQALFLHLHAREFRSARDDVDRLRNALSISTADSEFLGALYGNRLRFANRTGADLATYREQLRTTRQVNKHLALTTAGLAQLVSTVTSSRPFSLPSNWLPGWYLGDHLLANALRNRSLRPAGTANSFDVFGNLATSNLNEAVREWVLGAGGFAGNDVRTTAPGPYTALPTGGSRVEVVFEAGWDGGDVSVTGITTDGDTKAETFTAPASLPASVEGLYQFASVSLVKKTLTGASASAVHVGLRDKRFVRLSAINYLNAPSIGASAAIALAYVAGTGAFDWNGATYAGNGLESAVTGSLLVGGAHGTVPTIYGATATTGTFTLPASGITAPAAFNTSNRLLVALDGLGEVPAQLTTGAGTPTPAQVASDINDWIDRWPGMGGDRAYVNLKVNDQSQLVNGQSFDITDQTGQVTTCEWNTGAVAAGRVQLDYTAVTTNQEAVNVVIDALAKSRLRVVCVANVAGTSISDPFVRIYQALAGPNTSSTAKSPGAPLGWNIVDDADSAINAFAGGSAPTARGTAAPTADNPTAYSDTAATGVRLLSDSEDGSNFASRSVRLVPGPLDAEETVLDARQQRSTQSGATSATWGPHTVTCADSSVFPEGGPEVLQPWQSGAQTIRTLARASGLEVWFSPDYDGPDEIQLVGLDCFGQALIEVIAWPGRNVVEAGTGLDISGTNRATVFTGARPTWLAPGLGLREVTNLNETQIVQRVGPDTSTAALRSAATTFSAFASSQTGSAWQLIDTAVAQSGSVFASLTAVNTGTINAGYIAVYRAGTAAGSPYIIRRGRGTSQEGSGLTITALAGSHLVTPTGYVSGPYDAWFATDGWHSATALTGTNDGLHTASAVDGIVITAPGRLLIDHEYGAVGKRLTAGSGAQAWAVISRGETVGVGWNDVASDTISTLGFLGAAQAWANGARVEAEAELRSGVTGPARGADQVSIEVDAAYAPTLSKTDTVTLYGSRLPDDWRAVNLDTTSATGFTDRPGMPSTPLNLEATSASDAYVEFPAPRLLDYRGLPVTLRAWISSHASASRDFLVEVSFDGGASFGTAPGSATVPATPFGSAQPSVIEWTGAVPAEGLLGTAQPIVPLVRITRESLGAAATDQWAVHEVILTSDFHAQAYLGEGTVAKAAHDVGADVLWVTSPEAADAGTKGLLGLPATPGQALEGYGLDAEGSERGHVDYLGVLHAKHWRADLTQDAELIGLYTYADWLGATLTNLSVVAAAPDRQSRVVPEQVSQVSGEALTISGPSNATVTRVALASAIDPQRRRSVTFPSTARLPGLTPWDRLYRGTELLETTQVGDRASATVGGAGATGNDEVTVTWPDTGTGPNSLSVTVVNPGARSPLLATQAEDGEVTLTLEHDGTTLVAEGNTARRVAQALNDLGTVEAAHAGTGADPLLAGDAGADAFSGGDPNPWRWIGASELQVASVGAGDAASFDEYGGGGDAYTLDYAQLTRVQTGVLDLGADYADRLWTVDLAMYRRLGHERFDEAQYERLNLLTDRTARTQYEAKTSDSSNNLYVDDGISGLQPVPKQQWRFLEPRFVQVDGAAFDPDSIYWLSYTAVRLRRDPVVQFLLEIRSGTTAVAAEAAAWRPIEPDALVEVSNGDHYHQLRASFWGIDTLDDLVVYGLGLRGVAVVGGNATAPGLVAC